MLVVGEGGLGSSSFNEKKRTVVVSFSARILVDPTRFQNDIYVRLYSDTSRLPEWDWLLIHPPARQRRL